MKKINLLLMAIFIVVISHAGIITVNNNTNLPGTPGQYASVQDAIDAANSGDTLMIQGSPIPYNVDIKITKTLVLIGPGYNPQTDNGYKANFNRHQIEFGISSSNSKLIGLSEICFNFTNIFAVSNFLISRCSLTNYSTVGTGDYPSLVSGVIIENCLITYGVYLQWSPVTVRNNIFTEGAWLYGETDFSHSVPHIIKNNLFLCKPDWALIYMNNAIIENNIFFNAFPADGAENMNACAFNNNYVFGTKTLPFGTNIGSGNITSITSVYTSYNCEDDIMPFNFRPIAGSSVVNAGTDGTDIGPTGGGRNIYNYPAPYPLTGEPPIPQIQKVTMPSSSCPPGGTINVTVKARKHN